mgnify:CR=1 FL=1
MPNSTNLKRERQYRGWHAIGQCIGVTWSEAVRMAKNRDLPVHRDGLQVYAYESELQDWAEDIDAELMNK